MSKSRTTKVLIFTLTLTCLGALIFSGVSLAMGSQTIVPGVTVLNADLSGLSREMAEGRLLLLEKEIIQKRPLVLRYDDRAWQVQPGSLGLTIDIDKVVAQAMGVGRRGSLADRFRQWRKAGKEGISIPPYVKIDKPRLEKEIGRIASEITVPPRDAEIRINPDETVEVVPSRDGISVDCEKACRDIGRLFENGNFDTEVRISLSRSSPQKTTGEIATMAINGLLASYATTFDPGDGDRSYNIKMAGMALDGLFISPGEVFSFNDVVGSRSAEAGYKIAKIIMNNEFVEGPGGGVCQVSSTLYNVVLLANLEILERSNHSLPVYYVPPGRDATVAENYIDFKFKNSTPGFLYLKTFFSPGRIIVKIYGDLQYRQEVTIRTKEVEVVPFKEIYVQDPTLGVGEVRLKRKGIPGSRVVAERVLVENGLTRVENLPDSLYRPVDQIITLGPGVQPPLLEAPSAVGINPGTGAGQANNTKKENSP